MYAEKPRARRTTPPLGDMMHGYRAVQAKHERIFTAVFPHGVPDNPCMIAGSAIEQKN